MSNSIDVPIIVVPGIMGSGLANHYELNPDLTWSARDAVRSQLLGYRLSELGLDGSGTSDAALDIVTRAHGLISVAYAPLVNALRERSSAPVYPFAYDWRRSVVENGAPRKKHLRIRSVEPVGAGARGWECVEQDAVQ